MFRELGKTELLMHHYDINIVLQIDFSKPIDTIFFSKALEIIKFKHRMAVCNIKSINKIYYFQEIQTHPAIIETKKNINTIIETELNYTFNKIENLIRINIINKNNRSIVFFTFSHVIADAKSALQFIYDLFTYYHNCNDPIKKYDFPQPIEKYFPSDIYIKTNKKQFESNKKKHKKRLTRTINFVNSNAKLQKMYRSSSLPSIMAAFVIKAFSICIKKPKSDIGVHLNLDLRTLFDVGPCVLSYYSMGVPKNCTIYTNTKLNSLIRKLENAFYKNITSLDFLKKGTNGSFGVVNNNGCSISFIKNETIQDLEKFEHITNIKIFGNCFYKTANKKKIFVLLLPFRNSLNISIHYDDRNIAQNEVIQIMEYLKTKIARV